MANFDDLLHASAAIETAAAEIEPAQYPEINALGWQAAARHELAKSYELLGELVGAVELEVNEGLELARWGVFSHRWNRRRQGYQAHVTTKCAHHQKVHRRLHLAFRQLWVCWGELHFSLTRGQEPVSATLGAVQQELDGIRNYISGKEANEA